MENFIDDGGAGKPEGWQISTVEQCGGSRALSSKVPEQPHHLFPGVSTADDKWTKEELEALAQENQKEARRQYAKRQQEKFQRLKECSLDKDNQKRYADRQKEWENISNRYKYPINEDVFESFVIPRNDGKNTDVQRPRNIIKKLKKIKLEKMRIITSRKKYTDLHIVQRR